MPYTKLTMRLAIIFISVVLVACSGTPTKKLDPGQEGQASRVASFDFNRAKQRPYKAIEFGENPNSSILIVDSARQEFRFAVEALRGGNQDLAEQQLKEMLQRYPELSGPAYNLAVLKKQQGDLEQASYYLEIAVQRNAHNFDALNLQAQILREQGEFDRAEQRYLSIINAWGGYAPAYRNLGVLYDLYMGRTEEALVYYRQYNYMLAEPDPQVNGWIIDTERRLGVPPLSFDAPEEAQQELEVDGGDIELQREEGANEDL